MKTEQAKEIASTLFGESKVVVEFIDKGFSFDQKFRIRYCSEDYLLRLSDVKETDRRHDEFLMVKKLHERGVQCSEPIQFGEDDAVCFGLYRYIKGESAEVSLPKMNGEQQFHFGCEAGRELRKIHDLFKEAKQIDEFLTRGAKHRSKLAEFTEAGLKIEGSDIAAHYVESHLDLLQNRPTTFRHGDFHPANLIELNGIFQGVIDFNRCDWGDPVDDFYKLPYFGAPLSKEYAKGHITGYFVGEPPSEFWPLYNLFVAMIIPADIMWTKNLFPQDLPKSIYRVTNVLQTHDFKEGGPPGWWTIDDQ